jgi:hypothetical protein
LAFVSLNNYCAFRVFRGSSILLLTLILTVLVVRGAQMTHWGRAVKKGVQAFTDSFGPGEFTAGGKKVMCDQCGASEFMPGSAQLNTAGMTFAGLDWADKSASTLACIRCGKIQWFLKKPEKLG